MSLKKKIELEDIKAKLESTNQEWDRVSKPYRDKYRSKKKEIISDMIDTFDNYCTSNGLTISKNNNIIVAKYGNLVITLEVPDPEEQKFGTYLVFELKYSNINYKIHVMNVSKNPNIPSKKTFEQVVDDLTQAEINRCQKDIDELRFCIENVNLLIDNLDALKLNYSLVDSKGLSKKFTSFKELLSSALK